MDKKTVCISCGIFQKELEALKQMGRLKIPVVFLDSSLHMEPDKLHSELDVAIEEQLKNFDQVILLYGDCHPYMVGSYDEKRVKRVEGINCCNIILDNKEYRRLRKEGAFFVFNEWANKWRKLFVEDIGLTDELAPEFMNSMHTSIVYINSFDHDIPYDILEEMSAYFDLPYSVMDVNLDELYKAIMDTAKS